MVLIKAQLFSVNQDINFGFWNGVADHNLYLLGALIAVNAAGVSIDVGTGSTSTPPDVILK